MEEHLPLTTFHAENREHPLLKKAALTLIKGEAHNWGTAVIGENVEVDGEEPACNRWAMTVLCIDSASNMYELTTCNICS